MNMQEMWRIAFCVALCLLCSHTQSHNASSSHPPPVFRLELSQHVPEYIDLSPRRSLREGLPASPLFPGKGIHYAFMWVGTPPQRVSVIMDTGSHHTAFPCTGCKCGQHVSRTSTYGYILITYSRYYQTKSTYYYHTHLLRNK
ncbi:hypothetical protein EON64_14185 [archaeon]|nr:MAG: hypothetical protein EON64_14185 [archaeon]